MNFWYILLTMFILPIQTYGFMQIFRPFERRKLAFDTNYYKYVASKDDREMARIAYTFATFLSNAAINILYIAYFLLIVSMFKSNSISILCIIMIVFSLSNWMHTMKMVNKTEYEYKVPPLYAPLLTIETTFIFGVLFLFVFK